MAEINIEKKKRPIWPWVIGVILIAAIIWLISDNDDDPENETMPANTEENAYQTPSSQDNENKMHASDQESGPAMEYVAYVENSANEMTMEHEYTHEALTHLSKALNEVAENPSQNTKSKIDDLTMRADQLMQNTYSDEHADVMSQAFRSAADALKSIQQDQYPELQDEVSEVEKAAKELSPDALATDQKEAIRNFFTVSANVVGQMANQQNI